MKIKYLILFVFFWCNSLLAKKQLSTNKLQKKSLFFLVNNLDSFNNKGNNIIKEFIDNKNRNFCYSHYNRQFKLSECLYSMKRSGSNWISTKKYNLNFKNCTNEYRILDSSSFVLVKKEYDIIISAFPIMNDGEFNYTITIFRSIGLEDYYDGQLICKFDLKGNLIYCIFTEYII